MSENIQDLKLLIEQLQNENRELREKLESEKEDSRCMTNAYNKLEEGANLIFSDIEQSLTAVLLKIQKYRKDELLHK